MLLVAQVSQTETAWRLQARSMRFAAMGRHAGVARSRERRRGRCSRDSSWRATCSPHLQPAARTRSPQPAARSVEVEMALRRPGTG
ncbi:hypothetical protein A7D16_01080 [Xanthomonas nasturtii]|nr:hypothetical protein A7D16_01080 [Xanthomonas nasturtii]